jgi:hypothetical protein
MVPIAVHCSFYILDVFAVWQLADVYSMLLEVAGVRPAKGTFLGYGVPPRAHGIPIADEAKPTPAKTTICLWGS